MRQASTAEKLSADSAIGAGSTPAAFARVIAAGQQRRTVVVARAKVRPG